MSVETKKRFKNLGKIVGIGLFTILMLTNIKLALLDENEIASGDISVLGIEVNLFEATYACSYSGSCDSSCDTSTYYEDGWWHYAAVWTQECSWATYVTIIPDDICW